MISARAWARARQRRENTLARRMAETPAASLQELQCDESFDLLPSTWLLWFAQSIHDQIGQRVSKMPVQFLMSEEQAMIHRAEDCIDDHLEVRKRTKFPPCYPTLKNSSHFRAARRKIGSRSQP